MNYELEFLSTKLNESIEYYKEKVLGIHMFGINYASFIKKYKFTPLQIVKCAGVSDSFATEVSKGVKLSEYVSVKQNIDLYNLNIIGIHMELKNSALSDEHPHVCIGWSMLGDLSNIKTKDDLNELYAKISPNDSPQRRCAGVGQIWIFLNYLP